MRQHIARLLIVVYVVGALAAVAWAQSSSPGEVIDEWGGRVLLIVAVVGIVVSAALGWGNLNHRVANNADELVEHGRRLEKLEVMRDELATILTIVTRLDARD